MIRNIALFISCFHKEQILIYEQKTLLPLHRQQKAQGRKLCKGVASFSADTFIYPCSATTGGLNCRQQRKKRFVNFNDVQIDHLMKYVRLGKFASENGISYSDLVLTMEVLDIGKELHPNTKLSKDDLKAFTSFQNLPDSVKEKLINQLKRDKADKASEETTHKLLLGKREELGAPKTIFKYYGNDQNAIDAIINCYLYHCEYSKFNDPFDCYTHLLDVERVEGYHYEHRHWVRRQLDNTMEKYGICCFSRLNNSILMWSHYSNKHQGFCVEFDYSKLELNLFDINYIHDFKKVKFIKNRDALYHLIYTKSSEWAYEKELRSFVEPKDGDRKVEYNPNAIKAIYFGVNTDLSTIKLIGLEALKNNPKVKFFKGKRDTSAFNIEWKRLDRNFFNQEKQP